MAEKICTLKKGGSSGGTSPQDIVFTTYARANTYTISVDSSDLIIINTYQPVESYGVSVSGATYRQINSGNLYMWLCTPTQNTVTITASDNNIGVFKLSSP